MLCLFLLSGFGEYQGRSRHSTNKRNCGFVDVSDKILDYSNKSNFFFKCNFNKNICF